MEQILLMLMSALLVFTLIVENKRNYQQSIKKFNASVVLQKKLQVLKATQEIGFKEQLQGFAHEMGIEDNDSDFTISQFVRLKRIKKAMEMDWSSRFCPSQVKPKKRQQDSHLVKRVTTECRFLDLHQAVYLQIIRMKGDKGNGEVCIFESK